MTLQLGDEFDLTIDRLGINGEGVAKWQGFTLFIEGALSSEKVRVKLTEKRKNFGRAELLKILLPSKERVSPPCLAFGQCGGCQLMHLSYNEQLQFKRDRVFDALERIGKFSHLEVDNCHPSPNQLAYRNKIQMPSAPDAPFRLGLYMRHTHDLVAVDHCHIHCSLGEIVLKKVKVILSKANPISIKHVLIKTAVATNEVLVILVTGKKEDKVLEFIGKEILRQIPEVKGVVQNFNPLENNVILSQEYCILAGNGFIYDNLLNCKIKISAASFFQVNPLQAEHLYLKAIELCQLKKTDTVLDAYCGVGTLSLALARHAAYVIGVECVPDAILNAKENALSNGISNIHFECGQSEHFIKHLSKEKKQIDIVLINPPRKGCDRTFLDEVVKLSPRAMIYISCDPATLARDLQIICTKGYRIDKVCPFDMFPQTAHVECAVRVVREDLQIRSDIR